MVKLFKNNGLTAYCDRGGVQLSCRYAGVVLGNRLGQFEQVKISLTVFLMLVSGNHEKITAFIV